MISFIDTICVLSAWLEDHNVDIKGVELALEFDSCRDKDSIVRMVSVELDHNDPRSQSLIKLENDELTIAGIKIMFRYQSAPNVTNLDEMFEEVFDLQLTKADSDAILSKTEGDSE